MNKSRKVSLAVLSFAAVLYLIYPYYCAYQLVQAVKSGEAQQLDDYVHFPSLQASLKQQIDASIEEQAFDPMSQMMAAMFKPMLERMVDELVKPEVLAEFLQTGKLPNKRRKANKVDSNALTEPLESWYAFFVSPLRFEVLLNDLALYLELREGRWQLSGVGVKHLMARGAAKPSAKEPVVEQLNLNPYQPTIADTDKLKRELSSVFFITGQFGDKAQVEGDFYHLAGFEQMQPKVSWSSAVNEKGEAVLGRFSAKELADREKYNSANNYHQGRWSDKAPLLAGKKVAQLEGVVKLKAISQMQYLSFTAADLKQLKHSAGSSNNSGIAATLTQLDDGQVAINYYYPAQGRDGEEKDDELEPVFIIKNASGQALKQGAKFSSRRQQTMQVKGLEGEVFGASVSVTVAGKPALVEVYLPSQFVTLSARFVAKPKPKVSFGKLESPIDTQRYARAVLEDEIKSVDLAYLKAHSKVEFIEKTQWDKTKQRLLRITLPKIANSVFAVPNYAAVEAYIAGKKIDFKPLKSHSPGHIFSINFGEPNKDWGDSLAAEDVKGVVRIKYPGTISRFTVKRGEAVHGASIDAGLLTYPKEAGIPPYTFVWKTRSAQAYSAAGKPIMYLDNASFWNRSAQHKVYFWGKPDYVELKRVEQWLELELALDIPLRQEAD